MAHRKAGCLQVSSECFLVHENQGISYGTNFPALFQVSSEFRVFEDAIQVLLRDCSDLSTFAAPERQLQLTVLLEFIRVLFENQLAHEASQPFGSRHASGSHNLIEIAANLPAHHAVRQALGSGLECCQDCSMFCVQWTFRGHGVQRSHLSGGGKDQS